MSSRSVLCFGEALIDFHALAPSGPHMAPAFLPHAGGAPANVAVAVARLGGSAAFIGMLAHDMFGDFLARQLEDAGVDITHTKRTHAANTALAFVSHDAQGERSFSFYRPPSADLLFRDTDFDAGAFASGHIFHACSNSLVEPGIAEATLSGMTRARKAGTLVSFDMNLRPALWAKGDDPRVRIWDALAQADVVKLSSEEMDFLAERPGAEQAVIDRLWQHRARLLVVTRGAHRLTWFTRHGHGTVPTFSVPAVDTSAAGDAFVGGLLYSLTASAVGIDELDAAANDAAQRDTWLRFASACGALAVTRAGAFSAMPALDEVRAFLESHA